jgi:hypothetical protein
VAGHMRLELRNVVTKISLERSHRFAGIQPNSGFGDCSRLSCAAGEMPRREVGIGGTVRHGSFRDGTPTRLDRETCRWLHARGDRARAPGGTSPLCRDDQSRIHSAPRSGIWARLLPAATRGRSICSGFHRCAMDVTRKDPSRICGERWQRIAKSHRHYLRIAAFRWSCLWPSGPNLLPNWPATSLVSRQRGGEDWHMRSSTTDSARRSLKDGASQPYV